MNPARGNVEFNVLGKVFNVVPNFALIEKIESKFKCNCVSLGRKFQNDELHITDIRDLILICLWSVDTSVTKDSIEDWLMEEGVQAILVPCLKILVTSYAGAKVLMSTDAGEDQAKTTISP